MDQFIDSGYKIGKTCTQTTLHAILMLSDSLLLPVDLEALPKVMKKALGEFEDSGLTAKLMALGVTNFRHLSAAVDEFEKATKKFMADLVNVDRKDPLRVSIDQVKLQFHLTR